MVRAITGTTIPHIGGNLKREGRGGRGSGTDLLAREFRVQSLERGDKGATGQTRAACEVRGVDNVGIGCVDRDGRAVLAFSQRDHVRDDLPVWNQVGKGRRGRGQGSMPPWRAS